MERIFYLSENFDLESWFESNCYQCTNERKCFNYFHLKCSLLTYNLSSKVVKKIGYEKNKLLKECLLKNQQIEEFKPKTINRLKFVGYITVNVELVKAKQRQSTQSKLSTNQNITK